MPIYAYECESCRKPFDVMASIRQRSNGWTPECPNCGSKQVRQKITSAATLQGVGKSPAPSNCCSGGSGCCG